jgi:hypothetical protein
MKLVTLLVVVVAICVAAGFTVSPETVETLGESAAIVFSMTGKLLKELFTWLGKAL